MKYIDIKTVVNSYQGFQNCMTNKSWGYLALLKGCDNYIRPSVSYEVDMNVVSNFLEGIFNLSPTKRQYSGGRSLFVVFSNVWENYFNDQGQFSPNIYDIAAWAYRRKVFNDKTTEDDIIKDFTEEFHIPSSVIEKCFDAKRKGIIFSDTLYSESDLKIELRRIDVDVSSDNIDAKKGSVVASPGEISRGPFVQTLYAGLDITEYVLILQSNYDSLYGTLTSEETKKDYATSLSKSLQQIFYGAPGTGKSNTIKKEVDEQGKKNFRVTFHPDSDYSTFVGAYKPAMKSPEREYSFEELVVKLNEIKLSGVTYPCHKFSAQYWKSLKKLTPEEIKQLLKACGFTDTMNVEVGKGMAVGEELSAKNKEEQIVYRFVPQAFTKAYTAAWNTEEDVFLIIEEINRGNCAQIFGDLFQLLDRGDDGFSEYPVDADSDLAEHIAKELSYSPRTDFPEGVKEGKKLVLPKNLFIWATMNTSDQSLFPIDSAFKRRWDWKYVPIYNSDEGWQIEVKDARYDWWDFLEKMNDKISTTTHSEDKKLGYYFCKTKDGIINAETFVGKVIFYVWNDVFKDFAEEAGNLFKDENGDLLSYDKFYGVGADGKTKVLEDRVALFLEHLEVKPIGETNSDDVEDENEEEEEIAGNQRKETLVSIQIPNNPTINSSDSTQFGAFLKALKTIGIERIIPIAGSLKYQRLGCPVLSTQKDSRIENNGDGYSYQQEGELFIIKGCKSYTYIRILEDLNKLLNVGLSLITQ